MVITQTFDETFIGTGQFAEAAYCGRIINVDFLLDNIDTLLRPDFLLEGYTALRGAVLVSHFKGSVADLPVYVVYRPSTKQLIVGISGTTSMKHAYHDLRTTKHRHPSGHGLVHSGFWSLYQGIKPTVLDALARGLTEHDVEEVAITGHSMGGSVSHLLAIDLLSTGSVNNTHLPPSFTIAVFGTPRTGNSALVDHWHELVDRFRKEHGQDAFKDYSVKAYNDGLSLTQEAYRN
jgi:pimeloyl-ACP methyl ester carboxylesterase